MAADNYALTGFIYRYYHLVMIFSFLYSDIGQSLRDCPMFFIVFFR